MLTCLCATTQMGLQLTDNPLFRANKPSVNSDYVCFYKKNSFVHGLSSTESNKMWLRVGDDHNCDTFYFVIVQSLTTLCDMIRCIFSRLCK